MPRNTLSARTILATLLTVSFAAASAVDTGKDRYLEHGGRIYLVDDATINSKNVADLVFNEEQASYLAGVAAAKTSKSKVVGFVGGVDIPLIHKFQAGFAQGVKDTNPKATVLTQYLTQTAEEGGFSSPDKGKTAAEGQIEKKADVVYAVWQAKTSPDTWSADELRGFKLQNYSERRRQPKARHEFADDALHEADRHEDGHQRQCRGHYRGSDLSRSLYRRLKRVHALFVDKPVDVLQHYDRIVDHDTDHESER